MNKVSGGDGFPVELFEVLKDDAVKVLHSICQQIWKTQQWPIVGTRALAAAVLGYVSWHKSSWKSPLALPKKPEDQTDQIANI